MVKKFSKIFIFVIFLAFACLISQTMYAKNNSTYDYYIDLHIQEGMFGTSDTQYIVYLDDTEIGEVELGRYFTYLSPETTSGKHIIKLVSVSNEHHKLELNVNVKKDMTSQYEIQARIRKPKVLSEEIIDGTKNAHLKMPNVLLETYDNAVNKLEEAGFVNYRADEWDERKIKYGESYIVKSQNINVAEEADKNQEIILECELANQYFYENLREKTYAEAEQYLQKHGYIVSDCKGSVSKKRIESKLEGNTTEKDDWYICKIVNCNPAKKQISLEAEFRGEREIVDYYLSKASLVSSEIKDNDFSNVKFISLDGKIISEKNLNNYYISSQNISVGQMIPVTDEVLFTCESFQNYFSGSVGKTVTELKNLNAEYRLPISYSMNDLNIDKNEVEENPNLWEVKEVKIQDGRGCAQISYLGTIETPNLFGKSFNDANSELKSKYFLNIRWCDENNQDINMNQDGFVYAQSIQPGEQRNPNDEIVLTCYTFENMDKMMYSKTNLNVRGLPNGDADTLGMLGISDGVSVTGRCVQTGWYRIKYNDTVGYVCSDYMSEQIIVREPQQEEIINPNANSPSDINKSEMVYATPSGKKYHRQWCRYVKSNSEQITLEEAKRRGLEPCQVCH